MLATLTNKTTAIFHEAGTAKLRPVSGDGTVVMLGKAHPGSIFHPVEPVVLGMFESITGPSIFEPFAGDLRPGCKYVFEGTDDGMEMYRCIVHDDVSIGYEVSCNAGMETVEVEPYVEPTKLTFPMGDGTVTIEGVGEPIVGIPAFPDFDSMTVPELRKRPEIADVKGRRTMKRADLLAACWKAVQS